MSKNSGMGRKRIENRDSKGLGKCLPRARAEQCGNGKLNRDKFQWSGKASASNPFCASNPLDPKCDEVEMLKKQATELEGELKQIRDKIFKLNIL